MRIVGGRHRGRRLRAPAGARPTADRLREALFDILTHGGFGGGASLVRGAVVVDAFAGSGALGLEALSRGAARLTCMERDPAACAMIGANAEALGEEARVAVLKADATRPPPAPAPCDLVFLDPPYGKGLALPALAALARAGWIAANAVIAVELAARDPFQPPEGFALVDERRYGRARILFLRRGGQSRNAATPRTPTAAAAAKAAGGPT